MELKDVDFGKGFGCEVCGTEMDPEGGCVGSMYRCCSEECLAVTHRWIEEAMDLYTVQTPRAEFKDVISMITLLENTLSKRNINDKFRTDVSSAIDALKKVRRYL